jgi:pimeloyl-ACP methyl ester carboxylesterase
MPPSIRSGLANGTAFNIYGTGDTLVLIHGVGLSQATWGPQVVAFAGRYQVIAYDMLGHGESVLPSENATLNQYATQLATLLDHLGIDAASVIGHSMGALVALEFALNYPARAIRVATLNAVYRRTAKQRRAVMRRVRTLETMDSLAAVDATLTRWFGQPIPPHLIAQANMVRLLLMSANPIGYARTYRLFATSDYAHVGRLCELAAPALFMTGELDANSSPEMSRAMGDDVPHAQVAIVPGERHMMSLTAPDVVNQRLRTFIETTVSDAPAKNAKMQIRRNAH